MCTQENECGNRMHRLQLMIPKLRRLFEDCKVECDEADECGDLEDRILARYRLDEVESTLRSAEHEFEALRRFDERRENEP